MSLRCTEFEPTHHGEMAEKRKSALIIDTLNEKYYDKYGYKHRAEVYTSAPGSRALF